MSRTDWGKAGEQSQNEIPVTRGEKHPVYIRKPEGAPLVKTATHSYAGEAGAVACSTCHDATSSRLVYQSEDMDEFHQGLTYAHGKLSCTSCHNANDYDQLRLADGTALAFTQVMELCQQCHGPQSRDYQHGSHGGMVGYWDLGAGPRARNNCIDCHDPHAPAYPQVQPVFAPKDRIITPVERKGAGH